MSDLAKRLREVAHTCDEYGVHSEIELEAADRIAELEAALQKIADRTKRAHPQSETGAIHQIAITALTHNTQENING